MVISRRRRGRSAMEHDGNRIVGFASKYRALQVDLLINRQMESYWLVLKVGCSFCSSLARDSETV